MHLVLSHQVTPLLVALFDFDMPAALRCCAVLAGLDRGLIYTDDLAQPTWGAVWEAGDGTLYLGGRPDAATVHRLVATLRHAGDVLYGLRPGDPWVDLLPPAPDYSGRVLEFDTRPQDGAGLEQFLAQMPKGYLLIRPDRMWLERGLWAEDTIRYHGTADAFLAKGRALFLLYGDVVVCEAYAGACVQGVRELGAITAETQRGRGLATLTVAHLIHACEQAGERTYWNCAAGNLASAALARKLGYTRERAYQLFGWYSSSVPAPTPDAGSQAG
jgi:hypothetical protein